MTGHSGKDLFDRKGGFEIKIVEIEINMPLKHQNKTSLHKK